MPVGIVAEHSDRFLNPLAGCNRNTEFLSPVVKDQTHCGRRYSSKLSNVSSRRSGHRMDREYHSIEKVCEKTSTYLLELSNPVLE